MSTFFPWTRSAARDKEGVSHRFFLKKADGDLTYGAD